MSRPTQKKNPGTRDRIDLCGVMKNNENRILDLLDDRLMLSGSEGRFDLFCRWAGQKPRGPLFWTALSKWWPSMDLIDHERAEEIMADAMPYWTPSALSPSSRAALGRLHGRVTIYRGQDEKREVGLSWTTSQERALWFARGYRNRWNLGPIVVVTEIDAAALVMAFDERNEAEVVPAPFVLDDDNIQMHWATDFADACGVDLAALWGLSKEAAAPA